MNDLFRELQIHQVELEAQNEALRLAKLELENSRARYAELFEFAPIAYVSLNDDSCMLEVNRAATDLLEAPREALVGVPLSRFVDQQWVETFARHRTAVLRAGERQQCELQLSGVRGVTRRVRIESMRTHTGAWRAALIDITERYLLERQLAEARKLEAISTLASGVAHEFNNRLMAITGCADMALRQLDGGKDARGPIEQLKQAAM